MFKFLCMSNYITLEQLKKAEGAVSPTGYVPTPLLAMVGSLAAPSPPRVCCSLCQGQTWPSQVEEGFGWGQGGCDGSVTLEKAFRPALKVGTGCVGL